MTNQLFKRHIMKNFISKLPKELEEMKETYKPDLFRSIEKVCLNIKETHKYSYSHVEERFHPAQKITFLEEGTNLKKQVDTLCAKLQLEPPGHDIFQVYEFFKKLEKYIPKDLKVFRVTQRKLQKFKKSKNGNIKRVTGCDKKNTFQYLVKTEDGKNVTEEYRKENLVPELQSRRSFMLFCEVYGKLKGRLDNCLTSSVMAYGSVFNKITFLNHFNATEKEDPLTRVFLEYLACTWCAPKCFSVSEQEVGGLDEHAVHLYNLLKVSDSTNWFWVGHMLVTDDVLKMLSDEETKTLLRLCYKTLPAICYVLQHQWIKGVSVQAQMKYKLPGRGEMVKGRGRSYVRKNDPNKPRDAEPGINTLAYNQVVGAYNRVMSLTNCLRNKLDMKVFQCYKGMQLVARDQQYFTGEFSKNPVLQIHKYIARKRLSPPWGGFTEPKKMEDSKLLIQSYIKRNKDKLCNEKYAKKDWFKKLFELTNDNRGRSIKVDYPMVCGVGVPINLVDAFKEVGAYGSTNQGNVPLEEGEKVEEKDEEELELLDNMINFYKNKHNKKQKKIVFSLKSF